MASGVNLRKASALEHAVLRKYFEKDRWARVFEAKALAFAACGNPKATAELLKEMTDVLLPELDHDLDKVDFRERASKSMRVWDTRVLAIEHDAKGRPGVKKYNISQVEQELIEFSAKAKERILRLDKGPISRRAHRQQPPGIPPRNKR